MNLQELTGQESGLVIYVGMGENVPAVTGEPLEDLGEAINGVDVVDASSGVTADDLSGPATLYRVAEGVDVVAPAGWA